MNFVRIDNNIINIESISHIELHNAERSNPQIMIHFIGGNRTTIDGKSDIDEFLKYLKTYTAKWNNEAPIPPEIKEAINSMKDGFALANSLKGII